MLFVMIGFSLSFILVFVVSKTKKTDFDCIEMALFGIVFSCVLMIFSPYFISDYICENKEIKVKLEKVNGTYYDEDYTEQTTYIYKDDKKQELFCQVDIVEYKGDEAYLTYYEYDTSDMSFADKVFWFPTQYFANLLRSKQPTVVTLPESEK